MVAVLRVVLVGTLGTGIVKEREVFVSLALRLASIIIKVEGSSRIEELAMSLCILLLPRRRVAAVAAVASGSFCVVVAASAPRLIAVLF